MCPKAIRRALVGISAAVGTSVAIASPAAAAGEPDVVAHRGMGHATAAEYRRAAPYADVLEGDIQITKDNKLVINHDARLPTRRKGCTKKIKYLSWAKVHRCVPTVISLGTLVGIARGSGRELSLELKNNGGKTWTSTQLRRVRAVVNEYGMARRTVIYSFQSATIAKFRRVGTTGIRTGLNSSQPVSAATVKQAGGLLAISQYAVDANRVAAYQKAGITVGVYTTSTDAQDQRALALGVDQIITDRAPVTRSIVSPPD